MAIPAMPPPMTTTSQRVVTFDPEDLQSGVVIGGWYESSQEEKEPKIIADEGWKEQAQKEKDKLKQEQQQSKEAEAGGSGSAAPDKLPPANFITLVNSILVQALYSLGALPDAEGKRPEVHLDLAKYHIDTLTVLEEKTKGNLSAEEENAMAMALHEVRMQYVQAAQ